MRNLDFFGVRVPYGSAALPSLRLCDTAHVFLNRGLDAGRGLRLLVQSFGQDRLTVSMCPNYIVDVGCRRLVDTVARFKYLSKIHLHGLAPPHNLRLEARRAGNPSPRVRGRSREPRDTPKQQNLRLLAMCKQPLATKEMSC